MVKAVRQTKTSNAKSAVEIMREKAKSAGAAAETLTTLKEKDSPITPGGVKKPRRLRPGTKALREIRRYQKSTELLIKKAPLNRLYHEIGDAYLEGVRFTGKAREALQVALEAHLEKLIWRANTAAVCAGRETLMVKDLQTLDMLDNYQSPHVREMIDEQGKALRIKRKLQEQRRLQRRQQKREEAKQKRAAEKLANPAKKRKVAAAPAEKGRTKLTNRPAAASAESPKKKKKAAPASAPAPVVEEPAPKKTKATKKVAPVEEPVQEDEPFVGDEDEE